MNTFVAEPRIWWVLSSLGSTKLVLPAVAILIVSMGRAGRRDGAIWGAALALMGALVLTSKVAFFGWGLGLGSIDFTGFSGHAALAGAVYPVIVVTLARRTRPHRVGIFAAIALLIAAAVALARVELSAHSASEAIGGWLVGVCASAVVLQRWPSAPPMTAARVLLAFCLAWSVDQWMLSDVKTERLVIRLALAVSGRDTPYHRTCCYRRSGAGPIRSPGITAPSALAPGSVADRSFHTPRALPRAKGRVLDNRDDRSGQGRSISASNASGNGAASARP